ncbi:membrane protein [Bacillus sp. FJAT-27916]|uniref:trimeric intracellular cation channel family protein n=1 Tax=Bacillaceae TaxID=186817 RepID=UPI0006713CA3|nr:trimeric intracellular cation channel family protein [Bacillus sp. FJAT-27916]KMY44777.1 membrane protein [Bacillus sp. FJAT-27916]
MSWDLLSIIGTIAFAISGALVAMEEEYDLFGIYLLGYVTAFGGGAVRNILLGIPLAQLWHQDQLFLIAFISIGLTCLFHRSLLPHWNKWGNFFDAIGLSAFAIQGALKAVEMDAPIVAVTFAAILTGSGGGIVRDVLAGRKPILLQSEIYAIWAGIAGLLIGFGLLTSNIQLLILFLIVTALRMLSYLNNWQLPVVRMQKSSD